MVGRDSTAESLALLSSGIEYGARGAQREEDDLLLAINADDRDFAKLHERAIGATHGTKPRRLHPRWITPEPAGR